MSEWKKVPQEEQDKKDAKGYGKLTPLIEFYLSMYHDMIGQNINENWNYNDDFQDRDIQAKAKIYNKKKTPEFSIHTFYVLVDELSEGAATFLRHRNEPQLGTHIE